MLTCITTYCLPCYAELNMQLTCPAIKDADTSGAAVIQSAYAP